MTKNSHHVANAAVRGGITGGMTTAAGGVLSGATMGTVTTTTPLWGWVPFGIGAVTVTTPVVLPFVLAGLAVVGFVGGAVVSGVAERKKIQRVDDEWERLTQE